MLGHRELCALATLSIFFSTYAHVEQCITPNSTEGSCVELDKCPELLSAFENQPLTTESIVFLRRSQCGYADTQPEVCCPVSSTNKLFKLPQNTPMRAAHVTINNRFSNTETVLPEPGSCGTQTFDNKIFGGEITAIDEFPWMALLEYKKKNIYGHGFACGGALINTRYVLTAAHCATGRSEQALGGLISVRLGEHNLETEEDCDAIITTDCAPAPVDIRVVKKIIHPLYKSDAPDQYHDIALLKLAHGVEYNDFVKPICLSKNITQAVFNSGKLQFVSGWGQTESGRNSPIKLKLKVPIVSPNTCSQTYTRFGIKVGNQQLCAGGDRWKDSCRGDSGGPLVVPAKIPQIGPVWYCTGIVSIGPNPCATRGVPGIYTKVSDYYDWIIQNIK